MIDLEKGPLRESGVSYHGLLCTYMLVVAEAVVKALDEAWLSVSPYATNYFH